MRLNERCVAEFSTSSAPIDKEGFLNKKGEVNRGYQRRWFILKGNLLYYFEKRSDKEPIGVIVLDNCHVELAESGEPYAFQITFGGDGSRTYILGADTPKEMESWMRAITHSNYEYLRMMVESFESTLAKLTSDDLVSSSSSDGSNISRTSGLTVVNTEGQRSNANPTFEIPSSIGKEKLGVEYSDGLDDIKLKKKQDVPVSSSEIGRSDISGDAIVNRSGSIVGNLINLDDDDDDQIPIQNEFALDEGFYSFHKHSTQLMPLSYSDLERLEDMHNDDLLCRLSGNIPSRSRDDSDLIRRVKREELSRQQRPKSERRRNNIGTMYHNIETKESLEREKSGSLPRSGNQVVDTGYHPEHGSVFKFLHEHYSASIWVKCKELWGQDNVRPPVQQ